MVAATQAYNAYQNANVYEGMDPNRLILMLYEGALQHLEWTKEGVLSGDMKKRGEHLGKVIAIVAELSASLDSNVKEEPIEFLRGLYRAMLLELPNVSMMNDVVLIDRIFRYLSCLRDIWKNSIMEIHCKEDSIPSQRVESEYDRQPQMPTPRSNPYANTRKLAGMSFSV